MREQALLLLKMPYIQYIKTVENKITINTDISKVASGDLLLAIETVQINYPEIFI